MAYHQFMQRLGYTSYRNLTHARNMDEFTVFRYLNSIEELDERFVTGWVHQLSFRGSASTKNHRISYARGFFEYLIRQNLRRDNPALSIPFLKCRKHRPHIYSLYEIHQILQEAAKRPGLLGDTLPMLILLLFACGLRVNEALKLRIRDVDFEQDILVLRNTKFHKERLVPFSPTVAAKLKAYLQIRRQAFPPATDLERFFYSTRRPLAYTYLLPLYHGILHRCGLTKPGAPSPCLHDFRHSFAVHRLYKWYQEGHNPLNKLPILSTYMGHVSIQNTHVYLATTQALLREGDKRFQKSFEDITHKSLRRALNS
jgi:site-specific recombinase XerD